MRTRTRALLFAAAFFWGTAVTGGAVALVARAAAGEHARNVPATWPSGSSFELAKDRPTVLVFVHPRCPCSRATLRELERSLAETARDAATPRPSVRIVFVRPRGATDGFAQGGLWEQAKAIHGVKVLEDKDGVEAARFGADLSGHVVVFDPEGRRTFSGGITPARGHEGDGPSRRAFVDALGTRALARLDSTMTFGCNLENKK